MSSPSTSATADLNVSGNTSPEPVALRHDLRVASLVGFAHGVSHFYHLILAPLFPWIKEAFQLSFTELGFLMTVFFVVSGIGQAVAGFVVDRVGALKVLYFGLGCLAASSMALFFAPSYSWLLLGSMLAGLGNSVFHPSDYTLLNRKVSSQRLGYAYSVHGITGNLGWFAAPLFLTTLAGLASWRIALLAASILPLTAMLTVWMFRDELNVPVSSSAKTRPIDDKDLATVRGEHVLAFMRFPQVWLCFAFFLISAMALGGIQSFSASSLRSVYGISLKWATSGYAAYMLASALGMAIGGYIAARGRHPDRTIAISFAAAAAMAVVIGMGWVPQFLVIVMMGVIGLSAGIAAPSRDLMIRGAAPKNATGRVYGVVYSGLDSGLALAPPLFGALMDGGHPAWVFYAIGAFQALAIVTAIRVTAGSASQT